MINKLLFFISFLCLTIFGCKQSGYNPPADPLFTKLSAEDCGIDFRNDIKDDSVFNETTYRNFYNGGGVAIGDINNDGLADVFMTANQGKNKLFLNKGNFKFEDITEKAGIVKEQTWSTGVTMADINADGLIDIYVCAAGNIKTDKRKNALFINQGNLKFKEEAAKYNLQDEGAFHTQATFFDYDLDGDLDVYLLNNNGSFPVDNFPNESVRQLTSSTGDKLMQNENGIFKDVSSLAGIYSSAIGFGLGISVGDINGDNFPDIYVSNDFFEKDYLYINERNGTFKEQSRKYISHMSQSSMGTDMADINNDGREDIFSTDMLPEDDYRLKKNTRFDDYNTYIKKNKEGYHDQLLSNMLQVNNGDSTFSEIAQFAGVNATDWSWGALIFDLNNDGWKDIVVCNGMYLDVTDQDYIDFTADADRSKFFQQKSRVSNYEQLKALPVASKIPNYAFVNQQNLTFKNKSYDLGLGEPGFSNGASYADLDNDGDLDLIVNNLNSDCFVYRNNTNEKFKKNFLRVKFKGENLNKFGIGAVVNVYTGTTVQTMQNFPTRGFQSCVTPDLNFGIDTSNLIDSLVVVWPDFKKQVIKNIAANKEIILKQGEAVLKFTNEDKPIPSFFYDATATSIAGNITHKENEFLDFDLERLIPHLLSTEGPKMAVADINGDGLEDFVVGASKHDTTKVFLQTANGKFIQSANQPGFAMDENFEDAGLAFIDIDKDGDQDLLIASGGNLDQVGSKLLNPRLYLNNGKGIFTRDLLRLPSISVNASCIKVFDFNNDGDPDVFIGGRSVPGQYGISPKSYLLQNTKGVFTDVTITLAPQLQNVGMVTDAIWVDIDMDNKNDLIVVGEWMPITIFKNTGIKLELSKLNSQFTKTAGWWNCIKAKDVDNDGDIDFVLGNLGLNTKLKADSMHPAKLYIDDFDKNGTVECVLSYYKSDGKLYPYNMRPDLVSQMPVLKKNLLKNIDYANKTVDEIFTTSQLKKALLKEAYQFQTCFLKNEGNGTFNLQPLASRAQFAPVFAILIDDLNKDQAQDIFLAGNDSGYKPELGRIDANFGTFLTNFAGGQFAYLSNSKIGLSYNGLARDLIKINTADKKTTIILSLNNASLKVFKNK